MLYTPFRYPPLKAGGRFHTQIEQSIFYGSEELSTAMAEVVYNRFLFAHHSEAEFKPMQVPYTHFLSKVKSNRSILLTTAPFNTHKSRISHPASYAHSLLFGSAMRQCRAELFIYHSARRLTGINVGLFSTEAFQSNKPTAREDVHWSVYVSCQTIEFKRAHLSDNQIESHVFRIEDFYVNGRIPIAF